MKRNLAFAGLVAMLCHPAFADDKAPGLPQGVLAQINLGRAGLLWQSYSNDQYGTIQTRIGEARATYAAVGAGGPTTGYQDGNTVLIPVLKAGHALADGKSYLRFELKGAFDDAAANQVENDGVVSFLQFTYQTFPSVDTMYSFGVFAENANYDIVGGEVDRTGFGLRLDGISRLSDHWGVAARAQYSLGEAGLRVPISPGVTLERDQGSDIFYTQVDLVGQYRNDDMAWIPGGWALYPIIGGQYQRNSIEEVTDSLGGVMSGVNGDTEEYGTAWVKAQLQIEVPPGHWAPNFTLGFEREWTNSLDDYVDEPTYVFVEASLSKMFENGNRLDLIYGRHQGLNGDRYSQSLLASFNIAF